MRTRVISSYGPTLTEAKNYLRVEVTDDDTLIGALITGSYEQITAECNRDFVSTAYTMSVFSSSGDIFLSTQTVNSVSTGSLKESGGSFYTYIDSVYTGNVSFGVGASGSIPSNAKIAQLMLINSWYENRLPEAIGTITSPLSYSVQALLSPYKIVKP